MTGRGIETDTKQGTALTGLTTNKSHGEIPAFVVNAVRRVPLEGSI
jgi:hypothetical protein